MGVPVGFWWSELTHPYYVLTERGYSVLVTRPCVTDPAVLEVNGLSDMGVDLLAPHSAIGGVVQSRVTREAGLALPGRMMPP